MNRQFTQAAVAIIGMTGLVTGMIITLIVPDLADARNLLLGGLIASPDSFPTVSPVSDNWGTI